MANNIGPYVSIQQIKDSTDVSALTDDQILALINDAMSFFDMKTRNFFNERDLTIKIEGNNTSVLHLGISILEIEYIKLNSSEDKIDDNSYIAFNGRVYPDDRRNPRIKLYKVNSSIFEGSSAGVFLRGSLTEIKGTFGFLESDGSTPYLVQQAIIALVIFKIKNPLDSQIGQIGSNGTAQEVKREKTDIHEMEWFESKTNDNSSSSIGTGIKIVDDAIRSYRAPARIGATVVDVVRSTLNGYGVLDE